ncbi:MAG: cyclic nucleotide-binding domain-containing protein [Deltaproteobacteria bacterium]|nr:cyclic nucleotide-binding domain-containing protein [Deltaproteobacteria bacterium]
MGVTEMLKGHDLFRTLTVDNVGRINAFSSTKAFKKGDLVFRHEDKGAHVFIMLEGRIHLTLPAAVGKLKLIVTAVENGEFFGLSPLLGSERYTATALCLEPTRVLAIEADPFRAVLEENHLIGMEVMGMVARAYFSRYIETFGRIQHILKHVPIMA